MAITSTRPAHPGELDRIHAELMEAIAVSPFYSDIFKAHEAARLSKGFLRNLMAVDPWHVLVLQLDGEMGGFMISAPEHGAIFLLWSVVFPEFRQSPLGMYGLKGFIEHWDNTRFHKASTYARPDNRASVLLLKRHGWTETARLETHMFGEDYLLFEKPLTKVEPGYDHGVMLGRMGRLRRGLETLVGR